MKMVGLGYFLRRWVVLEPLILFTTMAFGAYITQQVDSPGGVVDMLEVTR